MPLDAAPEIVCGQTLFHDDWWLDIAGGSDLRRVQVDGSEVCGSLAFVQGRYRGFTTLDIPRYTRVLGPVITLPPSKSFQRGRNIRHVCRSLVEQLPHYDLYRNVVVDTEVAMAFSWLGFTTTQRYSFLFPATLDVDRAWSDMHHKTRNMIRSAARQVAVTFSDQLDTFIDLSRRERPPRANRHDFALIGALFDAAVARKQATALSALDESGRAVAAALIIWGHGTAYYWLSARDRVGGVSGANALLLWRGFKLANALGMAFDLDGYATVASADFLAGFGQPPTVRVEVARTSRRYEAVHLSRTLLRSFTRRNSAEP